MSEFLFILAFCLILYTGIHYVKEYHNDCQPEIAKRVTRDGVILIIISLIGIIIVMLGM